MKKLFCMLAAFLFAGSCSQPSLAVRVHGNEVTGELVQDYKAQLAEANNTVESNPKEAQAYLHRAIIQRKLENFPAALSDYNIARKLSADDPKILIGRGIVLRYLGKNASALNEYEQALRIDPTLQKDLEENPETGFAGLKFTLAPIAANDQAIKRHPLNPVAYIERANTQLESNNWRAGIGDFTTAIKLAGNFKTYGSLDIPYLGSLQLGYKNRPLLANLYVWRGTTFKFHNKYAEARTDLERAIKLDTKNQYAYVKLGQICVLLGDRPAALTAFEAAARIDKSVSYELAQFYADQGDKQMEKTIGGEQCKPKE